MPDLLANILAEHTYDPVSVRFALGRKQGDGVIGARMKDDQMRRSAAEDAMLTSYADTHLDRSAKLREQLQEDAPGYVA